MSAAPLPPPGPRYLPGEKVLLRGRIVEVRHSFPTATNRFYLCVWRKDGELDGWWYPENMLRPVGLKPVTARP